MAYGLYQSDGTFISGFTSWISSDVIFTEECYIKFEIRRANNGTIAPAQAPAVYVKSYTKDLGNYKINRYLHVSLDDVNSCLKDLIDNSSTYTSLFDNSFLNDLKNIHDMFGTVFTLNTFNTAGTGYNISNMPTNYKNEFAENSNWLRFSFHAKDSSTRYDTSTGTIETDYATFINAIKTFASEKCLDNFIKLGFFTGNADTINLLNSSSYKPIGYFTADDTRLSYYLTQTQTDFINANNYGYDSSKNIYFMKSQTRLENISNVDTWLSNLDILNLDYLEIFTHEHEWDNEIKSKLIKILAFLNDLGYQNDYFNNHFKRQNILS